MRGMNRIGARQGQSNKPKSEERARSRAPRVVTLSAESFLSGCVLRTNGAVNVRQTKRLQNVLSALGVPAPGRASEVSQNDLGRASVTKRRLTRG